VYRWQYAAGQRSHLSSGKLVVDGIPCCGHHVTRTLEVDLDTGDLFVTCVSLSTSGSSRFIFLQNFSLISREKFIAFVVILLFQMIS
jgi:hypothetical protein